jgi:CAAX protease family protein
VSITPDSAGALDPIIAESFAPELRAPESRTSADDPPWGIVAAVITWFVSIAMLAVVPNLCVLPYVAYRYRGAGATREALLTDQTFVFLFVLGWVPAHLLTLALIWAVGTRLGKRSLKEAFGWSWSPRFGLAASSAVAILLFFVTLFLIGWLGGQKTDLDRILESSRAAAIALAFIAVATAPLVEEMIYRGLLYSAFQRVIGPWPAVALVAAMFAGLHVVQYWPNVGAISSITLLSVALTMIRARTGRLLPCFVVHLVFNGIQSVIIILEPYLQSLIQTWRHEPVNGALSFILHLIK